MNTLFEPEDIQAIAKKVVSMLLPLSKSPEQNDILNVDEASALSTPIIFVPFSPE